MDEIEYKLKCNNPAVIIDALGKVVTVLIEKKDFSDLKLSRELKFIKENCSSDSFIISLESCKSLINLVENDVIQPGNALSFLLSLLSNTKSHNGLISSISKLLCLDVKNKTHSNVAYINSFSLKDPQHPFITVLEKNPDSITNVLNEMKLICINTDELMIKSYSLELLRPVFIWILCLSTHPKINQYLCDALQLLMEYDSNFNSNLLLRECVNWQQISDSSKFSKTCEIYKHLCVWYIRYDRSQLPLIFPVVARISTLQLLYDCDPRWTYNTLLECSHSDCDLNISADFVATMLAHNIIITPSTYLYSLLVLCNDIVVKLKCNILSLNILKASMLQWLCYGNALTRNSLDLIVTIINNIEESCSKNDSVIQNIHPSNYQLFQFFDEYSNFLIDWHKTWNQISANNENILSWLQQLIDVSDCHLLDELFLPVLGLFLMDLDFKITLKTLEVLRAVVKEYPDKSVTLLPVLLHYLTIPRQPQVTVDVLKTFVLTGTCKINAPLIIFTITNLYNNKGIDLSLVIHLLTLLEEQQPRTFTYLQEYLLEKQSEGTFDTIREVEIAKAAAIKSVCKRRAAQHGPEFISILSQILKYSKDSSGVASALVLDALGTLWLEHIVSPVSTWNALSPRLSAENRPLVQASLCKLLGHVPALYKNNPEYNDLTFESLTKLWSLAAESDNGDVIIAALEALSHYSIKNMHLKQFPDVYKRDLIIKSDDPDAKPEDIIDYIPHEIWPTVFKYMNHNGLKGLTVLCTSLMRREIDEYRSGVYHTDGDGKEPSKVVSVARDSVVKGLIDFIKSETISPTHEYEEVVLLAVLDCMIEPYSKPLPPIDWCFLQQLFHQGTNFRIPSLLTGAKQAVISGSARRFVENYLDEFKPALSETSMLLNLFEVLPSFAQTISPQYIGSFVEKSLMYAFELYTEQMDFKENLNIDDLLFTKLLKYLKHAFASNKMSEENCAAITSIVETLFAMIHFDDLVWEPFSEICTQLTTETVNSLTSSSNWIEYSKDQLHKSTYIRCRIALEEQLDNPLNWLNEIIDNVLKLPTEHVSTLHQICPALIKAKTDKKSTLSWFLQLMFRTQEVMAEKPANEQSVTFLSDIIMMCVIIFSNRHLFSNVDVDMLCVKKEQRFFSFSNSLPHLIRRNKSQEWQTAGAQIIEWIHYARNQTGVPLLYRRAFYSALLSCKNCVYFDNQFVKAKLLSFKNV